VLKSASAALAAARRCKVWTMNCLAEVAAKWLRRSPRKRRSPPATPGGALQRTRHGGDRADTRHEFVPAELREYAYLNRPLPIGGEKTISQPYTWR